MANRYRVCKVKSVTPCGRPCSGTFVFFYSISPVAFTSTMLFGAWIQILCESETSGAQSLVHDDLLLAKPSTAFEQVRRSSFTNKTFVNMLHGFSDTF